jgi:hypothetical protein
VDGRQPGGRTTTWVRSRGERHETDEHDAQDETHYLNPVQTAYRSTASVSTHEHAGLGGVWRPEAPEAAVR